MQSRVDQLEGEGMKIAVVTGASSGIGRAAAIQIAARGVGVIATYNRNPAGARETVAAILTSGGCAGALPLDVGAAATFATFAQAVAAELDERWSRTSFDYLVNNAGFGQMAMFQDTPEELFDRFHRVILKGPYFLTQRLLPLLADGGAIVNVTSNSALTTGLESGYSAYATMKAGLVVLSRYLANELSVRGIRVNSVAPGPTRTRIADDAFERFPEVNPPLVDPTALGRLGESDDVGKVIAALLSDDFGWVTGQDIEVSGGFNLAVAPDARDALAARAAAAR
jgi:NAD(P)-dependent dehydrogenase (short-subunit alcohol dehydrogenase family)